MMPASRGTPSQTRRERVPNPNLQIPGGLDRESYGI